MSRPCVVVASLDAIPSMSTPAHSYASATARAAYTHDSTSTVALHSRTLSTPKLTRLGDVSSPGATPVASRSAASIPNTDEASSAGSDVTSSGSRARPTRLRPHFAAARNRRRMSKWLSHVSMLRGVWPASVATNASKTASRRLYALCLSVESTYLG